MPKRIVILLAFAIPAVVFVACGESEEEKQAQAQENVCTAAEEIEQTVGDLLGLTIVTASADQIEEDLNSISDNVETIADNAGDLRESERSEVEDSAEALGSTVETSLDEVGQSQSLEEAADQVGQGFSDLGSSVQALLAPIDC
ncbi:MAG: hypothetical protein ACR2N5_08465 [Solirubrobacterales bacterium]